MPAPSSAAKPPGTIVGIAYLDLNANGTYDPGEPPLSSWGINLADSKGRSITTIGTNSSGAFQFGGLAPGQYIVSEIVQSGYVNTSVNKLTVTVQSGQVLNVTITNGTFGNAHASVIQGIAYRDLNLNGTYDPGEPPLAGWTINLANAFGPVSPTITGPSGFFQFMNVVPGQNTVSEVVQSGFVNTSARTLNVFVPQGQTLNVTTGYGVFGNIQLASVQGVKYMDANMNDAFDPNTATFITQWGSSGTGNGQFNRPDGVGIDTAGNLYVADLNNNRVQKFDPYGNYIAAWGSAGTGAGQFLGPASIAVDSGGNVYVADSGNNRVQKFTTAGNLLTIIGGAGTGNGKFINPQGVAVDATGNLYVADTNNSRIQKFDNTGKFLTKSGNGQLLLPKGVAADQSGNVYVADTGNSRIQKFTSSGSVLTLVATLASGQLAAPNSVTTDASRNIYVADTGHGVVKKYTPTGGLLLTFGAFNIPLDVAVTPLGNVYVTDSGNNRIQKFGTDVSLPGWTINLAINSGPVGSVVTDANGSFQFNNLIPGQYTLSEVVQPGYANVSANTLTLNLPQGTTNVTSAFGAFGNVQLGSITGIKYLDLNMNGSFDYGDTPLPGWTINLANNSAPVGSAVTDGNGVFQFNNLLPGQYTVSEVLQSGYLNTSARTTSVLLQPGQALNVTKASGAFGNVQLAAIQGIKYLDSNLDGMYDAGDTTLTGWTINLTNSSGPVGLTTTDANGLFQFAGLVPGQYTVSEVMQSGYDNTSPSTLTVTLTSGENLNVTQMYNAFGNIPMRFAYVTNQNSNNLSVIDTITNTVVDGIPVGNSPYGVASTPDGTRAYVANQNDNTVSVIDTATNTVIGSPIPVGSNPTGIAITPDGTKAYVANLFDNTVSVIDITTNTVIGSPIPVGVQPEGIAVTPDGSRVYVTNLFSNTVSVIDTATNTVIGSPIPVGSGPINIVITPDGTRAYVVDLFGNSISVIETATNTATATIPVGPAPRGIAITPNGASVYVTIQGSNSVSVIDTATNTVIGTPIAVGANPIAVAITPDGAGAYVNNYGDNTVSVIDVTTNTVIGSPIAVGANPLCSAVNPLNFGNTQVAIQGLTYNDTNSNGLFDNGEPGLSGWTVNLTNSSGPVGTNVTDSNGQFQFTNLAPGKYTISEVVQPGFGNTSDQTMNVTVPSGLVLNVTTSYGLFGNLVKYAYVTNGNDNTVSVIDTSTNTVIGSPIPVGNHPSDLVVTPDGTRVYVANQFDNNVSVIDASTNTVIATIPVGSSPIGIAIKPDGTRVYVADNGDNNVSVIDASTNTVVATILVGSGPVGIAVLSNGTKAYVVNGDSNSVSVIDTSTNTVIGSPIPVGNGPRGIAVSPDGTKVYVVNQFESTVSVIDTSTNTVTTTIPAGALPYGIVVSPDGTKAYVVNVAGNSVSVIDTSTNTVIGSPIPVGNFPINPAVTPDGTKVYVTNAGSNSVSVIDTSTNTVTTTIPVGNAPFDIAVNPDP